MRNGIFKYTSLDTMDIKDDINSRLLIDEVLQNFPDSALSKMLINNVASIVDIANYNVESVAKEMMIGTMENHSSAVGKAQNFSHSIRRKVPSKANIQLTVNTPISVQTNDLLTIPKFSKLSVNGKDLLTTIPLTRKMNSSDGVLVFDGYYTIPTELGNFLLTSSEASAINGAIKHNIDVIEGEIKEFSFNALSVEARGTLKHQRYKIPDVDFSDLYGEHDISRDSQTQYIDKERAITQVSVAQKESILFSSDTLYQINRKSFTEGGGVYKDSYKGLYEGGELDKTKLPKICVIRSDASGGVELLFGDDTQVQTPSNLSGNTIGLRYLRTKGSKGNDFTTKGQVVSLDTKAFIYASDGSESSAIVNATFLSHLSMGQDVESLESIKASLPNYYSSKERLVTKADYVNYMKGLTSPFEVKNAVVFGEQEYSNYSQSNYEYFNPLRNIVVFSMIGSMYDTSKQVIEPRQLVFNSSSIGSVTDFNSTLNSQLLDGDDYDSWSAVAYYNLLSNRDLI